MVNESVSPAQTTAGESGSRLNKPPIEWGKVELKKSMEDNEGRGRGINNRRCSSQINSNDYCSNGWGLSRLRQQFDSGEGVLWT